MELLFAGLPAEQVFALAYLMALGRGQVGTAVAAEAVRQMREAFGTPRAAAGRMARRAGLAEDLADGLAELARAGVDVARLAPAGCRRPSDKGRAAGRRAAAVGR